MNRSTRLKASITGIVGAAVLFAGQAQAHFQMIIPSDDMVKQRESRQLDLEIKFWHPFEGFGINMAKPRQFGVMISGRKHDLLDKLQPVRYRDMAGDVYDGFTLRYTLRKPGDHIFYTEPQPYWEESEESFLIQYTKVVVNGFGLEEGWDRELGLRAEIVPLTRPYGLYAGNVFQGIVKVDGKPQAFSKVEIEYYNQDGSLKAEADPLITQVVKTDANGIFTYAIPRAGWWTFAAISTDDRTMEHAGKAYPVELGAVIWVKAYEMK